MLQTPARIALLCAPAGSGKSHLLRECASAAPSEVRLCWMDLREAGASADRLISHLAQTLAVPMPSLSGLCEHLAACRVPLWIMLDHLPCRAVAELDECLLQLLQVSSPNVRWWFASRRRPAWPLTRWLLGGELCELGAAHLALDEDELSALLADQGGTSKRDALLRQTCGWFAGVKLRLLAQQLEENQAGHERLLASYLECELLAGLDSAAREVLSMLACLPSFDQSLYDDLSEPSVNAPQISELLDSGAFVEPLAMRSGEFRIHPAVAPVLAAMLPARRRLWIYCRACQHSAVAGNLRRAVHFALLAEQPEMAASLMTRLGLDSLLYDEGFGTLLQWCDRLSSELRYSSPELILLQAWALLLAGRLEEASACSDRLAAWLPQPGAQLQSRWLASWQLLAAYIAQRSGQPRVAADLVRGVLQALPASAWVERALARLLLIEQAGSRGDESTLTAAALQSVRERGCIVLEGLLILQQAEQLDRRGEFARAESLARRVFAEVGEASLVLRGRALLHLGRSAWRGGRLEEAQEHYTHARELCAGTSDPAIVWAYAGLVELTVSQGNLECAFELLGEARRVLQRRRISAALFAPLLELLLGKLWLLQGKQARAVLLAANALERYPADTCWPMAFLGLDTRRQFELLRARAELSAESDPTELLESWLEQAERVGHRGQTCELWFALSEAHLACGRQRKAQSALFEGLALARRMGGLGSECHWHSFRPEIGRWVDKLEIDRNEIASIDASQLSRRERSVLGMIAEGLANQEIADRLHISVHTVKSHAQRINSKLGVSRRTQAIVRAKALGLLI